MKNALIIDGNSIINRAFYAIKNMATNQGFPTGAIYGFVNILNSVKEELNPDFVVVCFDLKGPTFRHEQYSEYKGTRKGMPEELAMQLPEVKNILAAMNIAVETLQGFEADDLLGAISKQFASEGVKSYLLTGDKDSLQLVDDMTFVYYHGTKNKLIYDAKEVFEDLGVYPEQVVDLKALMGDTSDNIPGVSGIGAVGARKLLSEFTTLENLLEHMDEIKAKRTRELIQAGVENAVLSKKLATIVRDLPVEIDTREYRVSDVNYEQLSELYKKFSLNKFLSQLIKKKNDEKFKQNDSLYKSGLDVANTSNGANTSSGVSTSNGASGLDMVSHSSAMNTSSEVSGLNRENLAVSNPLFLEILKSAEYELNQPFEELKFATREEVETFLESVNEGEHLFIYHMVDIEQVIDSKISSIALKKQGKKAIFISFDKNRRTVNHLQMPDHLEMSDHLQTSADLQTPSNIEDLSNSEIFDNTKTFDHAKIFDHAKAFDHSETFVLPTPHFVCDAQAVADLFTSLQNKKVKLVGHGLKSLLIVLRNYCIDLELAFDTQIAMYLCEANKNSYELHDLALYSDVEVHIKNEEELLGKGKSKINYFALSPRLAMEFMNRALGVIQIAYVKLSEKLQQLDMAKLYKEVELPLVKVLAELQYNGVCVDTEVLQELDDRLTKLIAKLEVEIYELAEEEFNISSPKQLGVILFEKLGLPAPKKNKTGYSTSHEVLVKLLDSHEIIDKIIEYRRYTKLKSTYIDGLRAVINPFTHRIHSSFNQTVAATGRLSSTEPNLQNIPIRLEIGREFRKAFVAAEDFVLVDADYSQIELRILAHMSGDEKLKEAYEKGIDIHTMTASQVFDVEIEDVSPDLRSKAKAVNFGIVYGMSDFGLSENLKIPIKVAGNYIKNYFAKYPKVHEFMENAIKDCKKMGYSETLLHRKRYIPEIYSKNFNIRGYGERIAMNTPIQGSAADIIKIAMLKTYEKLKSENLKSRLILQVHDELIIETAADEIEEVKTLLREAMEGAFKLSVELEVEMNVGKSWYDAK